MSAPIHTTERRKIGYSRELYEAALVAIGAMPEGHPNSDIHDAMGARYCITDTITALQQKIGRVTFEGRLRMNEALERADAEKAELRAQLAAAQKRAEEWEAIAEATADHLATAIGIGGTQPLSMDDIRKTPEFQAWLESQPKDEAEHRAWVRSRSMVKP